jgi:hypothetical protein
MTGFNYYCVTTFRKNPILLCDLPITHYDEAIRKLLKLKYYELKHHVNDYSIVIQILDKIGNNNRRWGHILTYGNLLNSYNSNNIVTIEESSQLYKAICENKKVKLPRNIKDLNILLEIK